MYKGVYMIQIFFLGCFSFCFSFCNKKIDMAWGHLSTPWTWEEWHCLAFSIKSQTISENSVSFILAFEPLVQGAYGLLQQPHEHMVLQLKIIFKSWILGVLYLCHSHLKSKNSQRKKDWVKTKELYSAAYTL